MEVSLTVYDNSRAFLEEIGEALYYRETINNLILGVSERLVTDPHAYKDPFFAAAKTTGGKLLLAAVMTPPHNMILAGEKDFNQGLSALIAYLQENQVDLPGIIGPAHITEGFARQWKQMVKASGKIKMRQRVYELRTVRLPSLPEGRFRIAFLKEAQLIVDWLAAFAREALHKETDPDLKQAETTIADGSLFLWERDGRPVSMAIKSRPIAHSITIGGVYTPPEHRRQGYATALVARLSQHLLDSGYNFVNLFTDLANPTSNSIYQKIGYHPVCDFRMVAFHKDDNLLRSAAD